MNAASTDADARAPLPASEAGPGVISRFGGASDRRPTAAERAERNRNRPPPGVYACKERGRDGGMIIRYRTHMGMLCKKDTTPEEAQAKWERWQDKRGHATPIGTKFAGRLGAILTDEHRAEYERMLETEHTSLPRLVEWLRQRGYRISVATVQTHRENFLQSLMEVQHSARMAAAFTAAAREQAPGAIAEAAAGRAEQLFMEMLFEMKPDDRRKLTVKDWLELQKASGGLVAGRRMMEQMRADFDDRARRAAEAAGAGRLGKGGVAVANRVREILGIPLLDAEGNEVGNTEERSSG